ncbi:TRAP transporter large permease subunit [Aminobacter aganoensis]|uniref:Tripartite ATP-independent transporter DctM subunit n=1 Tax=Aminobacter aganoensis TaxID=83264 RepID=A0A7X0F797_9HYPH|nr:TRAP transporter large permease subunit [Aminobacter aganoensis]MBB6354233.1 tripartite ATP-independent transporter DctM subunit [Aminobacter aganoensis]
MTTNSNVADATSSDHPPLLNVPDRFLRIGSDLLATTSSIWIFVIMAVICADIVMRSLFNQPLQGVPEIVAYSVPSYVFLAVTSAIRAGRFLRADFLYAPVLERYPRAGAVLEGFFNLAGTWVFYEIASGLWPKLAEAWRTAEFFGAVGVFTAPVWPFLATIFIGACLAGLQFGLMTTASTIRLWQVRGDRQHPFSLFAALAFIAVLVAGGYLVVSSGLSPITVGFVAIGGMLLLVLAGVHIATGLILLSFIGIWAVRGNPEIASRSLVLAAAGSINSYSFGVIPLFILMGLFVDIANVGRDAFAVAARLARRLKGGLGIATVFANAVFAAITGSSIASAAVFTRVATPQMMLHGYSTRFSVGVVAGSSVLGMLIPPSLLLIVYGLIAEVSVGKLFIAAVLPGLLLAVAFAGLIMGMARFSPSFIFAAGQQASASPAELDDSVSFRDFSSKMMPIMVLIAVVLGGIYTGFFTPTESGAIGAAGGLVIAVLKGALDWKKFSRILVEAAQISASVLVLIVAANLYSRLLTLTNIPQGVAEWIIAAGFGLAAFLAIYLLIVIVLGMFLDSVSIMLILLPLMLPVVSSLGGDLVWFGIVTTIAVEIGLLTPPFGLSVYVVKGTLPPGMATLNDIFIGTLPFAAMMLLVTIVLMVFPWLSLVFV